MFGKYKIRWGKIAESTRRSLSGEARTALEARVEGLRKNPQSQGTYDSKRGEYETYFSHGIIMYAVHEQSVVVSIVRVQVV